MITELVFLLQEREDSTHSGPNHPRMNELEKRREGGEETLQLARLMGVKKEKDRGSELGVTRNGGAVLACRPRGKSDTERPLEGGLTDQ